MTKSILTVSRDQRLQHSRTLVLQHGGYLVSAASNDKEAISFVENEKSINLVLLCHSVLTQAGYYL